VITKHVIYNILIRASAGDDVEATDSDVDSCVVLSCLSSKIVFEIALNAASARDLKEAAIIHMKTSITAS